MKFNYRFAVLALVLVTSGASSVAQKKSPNFSCYRNIYNNSNAAWVFSSSADVGNVYFLGTSCPQNGPCAIQPGTTVEIQYTYTGMNASGTMSIKDFTGETQSFYYDENRANQCPYIQHSGSTGAVTMNDPAYGDFSIGSDEWGPGVFKRNPKLYKMKSDRRTSSRGERKK